jgi:NAD(P)-dependent dehydrogenase (short-subunit alcohol dehydrogenase family)
MTADYYAGKTAVITGAASGMGLLTSKTLAAVGGNVVMCDLNEEGAKKAADAERAAALERLRSDEAK